MKRSRGRGRRQQNPVNRSYDSNGPDVRVRGTASQVYEKYQALARDAMSAGDRVMAENYQQHGEHYYRILQSFQPQSSESDGNEASASDEATSGDNNGVTNGGDATPTDTVEENGKGGEPLVLSRDNDGAEQGDDAPKSRRRGPLGKRRKAKPSDDANTIDGDAQAGVAEASSDSDGEAAISGE